MQDILSVLALQTLGSNLLVAGTSKYYSDDVLLGRNGTFLASLTAMCLLHIVSRHHENRSHNLLSFHHSKIIDRQLPAQLQHEIHYKHGTRVTVRNLFGNLPVRVKQRAALAEQKTEHDRLWETLKSGVTGLLLSWKQPVGLRIRDADGNTLLNFSNSGQANGKEKTRVSGLNSKLSILTHSNHISIDEWPSWIPASASTSTVSIKGAISLDPAPTKRVQFISLGVRPISADSGHNELFAEINRIFSLSSFGAVEDDAGIDADEKVRRQNDKRFKSDGYTNRQLTARKGVDRYPMFHLRISLGSGNSSDRSEEQLIEDKTNLQTVIGVLNAMITQWLSVHHFRPRKSRTKSTRHDKLSASASHAGSALESNSSTTQEQTSSLSDSRSGSSHSRDSAASQTRKRKRTHPTTLEQASKSTQPLPFSQWSRIKSGKADFFDTVTDPRKLKNEIPLRPSTIHDSASDSGAYTESPNQHSLFHVPAMLPGSLDGSNKHLPPACAANEAENGEDDCDETIPWTDPLTKRTYLLNARTGCVLAPPRTETLAGTRTKPINQYHKSIRLTTRPSTSGVTATPWLDNLLETWDNPVFKPAEKSIQQVCSHEHQFDNHNHKPGNSLRIRMDRAAFSTASTISISKLSKSGLEHAEVMAQLDKKFILVKMKTSIDKTSNTTPGTNILVLIDQHAADERIQVESLFSQLCAPLPQDHILSAYRSKLGLRSPVAFVVLEKPIQCAISSQEHEYFVTYAVRFAAWGILYNIISSTANVPTKRQQSILSVTTLPPVISERCKAYPTVLITFLRSSIWKFVESRLSAPPTSSSPGADSASWVRQLSTCPEGLVDLIHSRACRSAIMFNDELSLEMCKELVGKLAKCVFPFMCAHGRPSMVPLVDLGDVENAGGGFGDKDARKEGGEGGEFVGKWKTWRK
jgi:DNA mismatch repair protein MLH3